MNDPLSPLLAALGIGLAFAGAAAFLDQRLRVLALEAECADLWHEAQDERQRAELLRDDLACANRESAALRADWEETLHKLQRTRRQLELTHETNKALLDAQAAGRHAEVEV